jgi:hypothetical protein
METGAARADRGFRNNLRLEAAVGARDRASTGGMEALLGVWGEPEKR